MLLLNPLNLSASFEQSQWKVVDIPLFLFLRTCIMSFQVHAGNMGMILYVCIQGQLQQFAVDLISLRSGAPQEAVECPRFSKETLKRLGWSHSGSESGWYFWELLQVALGVYVYAGHSGPACWFAANLTSFEMQCPLYAIPFYSSKGYSKSCNVPSFKEKYLFSSSL